MQKENSISEAEGALRSFSSVEGGVVPPGEKKINSPYANKLKLCGANFFTESLQGQ